VKTVRSVADEAERILAPTRHEAKELNGNSAERGGDLAAFIHSNCGGASGRGSFVKSLIEDGRMGIACWGKCFNTHNVKTVEPTRENWYWNDSEGNRDTTKTDVMTRYPFNFALENTFSINYFTEKRYQVFAAGSVPIVFKNHNSIDYLPGGSESAVFPEDYGNSAAKFAEHIVAASKNWSLYSKYTAWKDQGINRNYVKLMFESSDFMACRICEYFANQPMP